MSSNRVTKKREVSAKRATTSPATRGGGLSGRGKRVARGEPKANPKVPSSFDVDFLARSIVISSNIKWSKVVADQLATYRRSFRDGGSTSLEGSFLSAAQLLLRKCNDLKRLARENMANGTATSDLGESDARATLERMLMAFIERKQCGEPAPDFEGDWNSGEEESFQPNIDERTTPDWPPHPKVWEPLIHLISEALRQEEGAVYFDMCNSGLGLGGIGTKDWGGVVGVIDRTARHYSSLILLVDQDSNEVARCGEGHFLGFLNHEDGHLSIGTCKVSGAHLPRALSSKPSIPGVTIEGSGPLKIYMVNPHTPESFRAKGTSWVRDTSDEPEWDWRDHYTLFKSTKPPYNTGNGNSRHPVLNAVRNEVEAGVHALAPKGLGFLPGAGHEILRLKLSRVAAYCVDPFYAGEQQRDLAAATGFPFSAKKLGECIIVECNGNITVDGHEITWVHAGNSYWHFNDYERSLLRFMARWIPVWVSGIQVVKKIPGCFKSWANDSAITEAFWHFAGTSIAFTTDCMYYHRYSPNLFREEENGWVLVPIVEHSLAPNLSYYCSRLCEMTGIEDDRARIGGMHLRDLVPWVPKSLDITVVQGKAVDKRIAENIQLYGNGLSRASNTEKAVFVRRLHRLTSAPIGELLDAAPYISMEVDRVQSAPDVGLLHVAMESATLSLVGQLSKAGWKQMVALFIGSAMAGAGVTMAVCWALRAAKNRCGNLISTCLDMGRGMLDRLKFAPTSGAASIFGALAQAVSTCRSLWQTIKGAVIGGFAKFVVVARKAYSNYASQRALMAQRAAAHERVLRVSRREAAQIQSLFVFARERMAAARAVSMSNVYSTLSINWYAMEVLVAAPIMEEGFKRLVSRVTGLSPYTAGFLFGILESFHYGGGYGQILTRCLGHAAFADMKYRNGVLFHFLHNLFCAINPIMVPGPVTASDPKIRWLVDAGVFGEPSPTLNMGWKALLVMAGVAAVWLVKRALSTRTAETAALPLASVSIGRIAGSFRRRYSLYTLNDEEFPLPRYSVIESLCVADHDERTGHKRSREVRPGSRFRVRPLTALDGVCTPTTGHVLMLWHSPYRFPTTNLGCPHNLVAALTSRGLGTPIWARGMDGDDFDSAVAEKEGHFVELTRICSDELDRPRRNMTDESIMTLIEWVSWYNSQVQAEFFQSLDEGEQVKTSTDWGGFVKGEILPNWDPETWIGKQLDPRLISVPTKQHRAVIGRYAQIAGKILAAGWGLNSDIVYAGGLTVEQLGQALDFFVANGRGVMVMGDDLLGCITLKGKLLWFSADARRCDMHITHGITQWNWDYMQDLLTGYGYQMSEDTLRWAKESEESRYRIRKKDYSVSAEVHGTRKSGSPATTFGNTPAMILPAINAVIKQGRLPTEDDYLAIGQVVDMVVDEEASKMEFLSRVVLTSEGGGFYLALKMGRFIAKSGFSLKAYRTKKAADDYCRAFMLGAQFDMLSHPVLAPLWHNIWRQIPEGANMVPEELKKWYKYKPQLLTPIVFGQQAWEGLSQRYSLTVSELHELADECSQVTIGGCLQHPAWRAVMEVDC